MNQLEMKKAAQFDALKDLITQTRKMCAEEGIKHPTLRLSEDWAWLLEDGANMLEFLKRSVGAKEIKWVVKESK